MAISLTDVIAQNTVGKSEGLPVGIPSSWGWYDGVLKVFSAPPSNFTSVTGWASVYQEAGQPAYTSSTAKVEVANAKTYVHLKTGEWVLVENQAQVQMSGAHFVNDFSGEALTMKATALPGGGTSFSTPPTGYNDHFWFNARGTYTAGMVDAVYVQMDMRVTDPNLHLIANVGADWWRDANAPFLTDFSNNPTAGTSNWSELSTQWTTLAFYSQTTAQFLADLPPPLVGSSTTDPEIKPTILSYTTDSGVAGDGITNDSTLTLSGTAKAGSSVSVYDGATKIGTTTANSGGNWSFTTGPLSNATHALTASTTGTTGQTLASSVLNVRIDTVAPVAPKITAFTPDTGTVGDGITTANQVTLTGTAEAGSTVKVFDGTTQIGVTKATATGTWSYQTAQLTNGKHVFTANSSDVAGNTSVASSQTSVTINSTTTTPPVTGTNLLVNGSFEASTVQSGQWAAFSSVPGWTAIAGGTIELWNNLNGVKATEGSNYGELDYLGARDGFYQTVKTVAGQNYELSFDARSRFAGSSSDIEVLWNNSVVATIPPGSNWSTYRFAVTGTGGQDRLTFRETSTESVDGLGALYDNVSLIAKQSAVSTTSTATNQTLDLVTQYAAANYASSAPSTSTLTSTQTSPSLAPTLTQPGYHD
jgi:hypothetical protein